MNLDHGCLIWFGEGGSSCVELWHLFVFAFETYELLNGSFLWFITDSKLPQCVVFRYLPFYLCYKIHNTMLQLITFPSFQTFVSSVLFWLYFVTSHMLLQIPNIYLINKHVIIYSCVSNKLSFKTPRDFARSF